MESSENRTEGPSHPPAGESAPAATGAEGTRSQNHAPSGTYFGLNRSHLDSWGVGAAPRDYKARYPPDPHGQEMSDNARIWPIYNEEAANFDANMLAEWRDTIDVLLVFAGLFSAVLTTFVAQTSQNMQLDYNQASTLLLFEILKATVSNGSQPSIPPSPTAFFSPSRSDEWINSLWFVSLTLSLIAALVAVLVKQWLHQYVAIVSDSSARERARIRHMRYAGLQTWQVPMIIGLLPVLLHVSLALFFAGFTIFLFSLGMKVAWLISIIGVATYMAYVVALVLPLIHPYCPYKVPLTLYIHRLYQCIHHLYQYAYRLHQYGNSYLIPRIQYCIVFMRHYPYTHMFGRYRDYWLSVHYEKREEWKRQEQEERQERQKSLIPQKFLTLKEIERNYIQQYVAMTDAQSLIWLHSSTSNASVHQSVLQAISGMTGSIPATEDVSGFLVSLCQQIEHTVIALEPSPGAESELVELELYLRAFCRLRGHPIDTCSNEQLEMVSSLTTTEKVSAAFLGILQGPQHSSLTLHPAVWKTLFDVTISSPPLGRSALALELEIMQSLASPLTTNESNDPTTIDNLTDETRRHICDKLLAGWGYVWTQIPDIHRRLDIMLSLIPRISRRLLDSSHASDRKEVMETALAIFNGIVLLAYRPHFSMDGVLDSFAVLFSLLSSESEASDVDVDFEIFYFGISMVLFPWMDFGVGSQVDTPTIGVIGVERWRSERDVNIFANITLILINRRRERILYMWVGHSNARLWRRCLLRLIEWASGEDFRRWTFLKRVLAIVVIGELLTKLDSRDDNERLPRYDNEALTEVNQLPWLREIPSPAGSSSDEAPNRLEYSLIAAHPKFQEFLNSGHLSQEEVHIEDRGDTSSRS